MTRRGGSLSRGAQTVVMALAPLLGAAILVDAYVESVPPSLVAVCWGEGSGRYRSIVVGTTRGETIRADHTQLRACPPRGAFIEKRRGEAVYRVDGQPFGSAFVATFAGWALLVTFGLVDFLWLLARRRGRGLDRPHVGPPAPPSGSSE
jgi:hypothetical protein